ncbi:MAG: putative toxin-antitoxin system toxin component, PIN family [Cyclobacteriaceae bacterium]|nr:putative toxin-antitoxin system toxin component, PIN family [Cyclobacteriaceae bacterium]
MKVAVDTNVVIRAAFSPGSFSFLAFEEAMDKHRLLVSIDTFEELQGTLHKPKFDKYFFPDDTRTDILKRVMQHAMVIIPSVKISACRDAKDNMFLELAISGKADCIITNDADLLVLSPFENIPIITPKAFLDQYS